MSSCPGWSILIHVGHLWVEMVQMFNSTEVIRSVSYSNLRSQALHLRQSLHMKLEPLGTAQTRLVSFEPNQVYVYNKSWWSWWMFTLYSATKNWEIVEPVSMLIVWMLPQWISMRALPYLDYWRETQIWTYLDQVLKLFEAVKAQNAKTQRRFEKDRAAQFQSFLWGLSCVESKSAAANLSIGLRAVVPHCNSKSTICLNTASHASTIPIIESVTGTAVSS